MKCFVMIHLPLDHGSKCVYVCTNEWTKSPHSIKRERKNTHNNNNNNNNTAIYKGFSFYLKTFIPEQIINDSIVQGKNRLKVI